MKKDKKGFAMSVEFIIKILLAILIFVPLIIFGCTILNKFVHSPDADDSFAMMYDNINLCLKTEDCKDGKSFALDMTDRSFIVGFNPNVESFNVYEEHAGLYLKPHWVFTKGTSMFGTKVAEIDISRPSQCLKDKTCICLCQGFYEKDIVTGYDVDYIFITQVTTTTTPVCARLKCFNFEEDFEFECIYFEGGFFMDRNYLSEQDMRISSYDLTKKDDKTIKIDFEGKVQY